MAHRVIVWGTGFVGGAADSVMDGLPAREIQQMSKPEIREIAASIGLNIAQKKDSQEICFVTTGRHAEFVAARKGDAQTSGQISLKLSYKDQICPSNNFFQILEVLPLPICSF